MRTFKQIAYNLSKELIWTGIQTDPFTKNIFYLRRGPHGEFYSKLLLIDNTSINEYDNEGNIIHIYTIQKTDYEKGSVSIVDETGKVIITVLKGVANVLLEKNITDLVDPSKELLNFSYSNDCYTFTYLISDKPIEKMPYLLTVNSIYYLPFIDKKSSCIVYTGDDIPLYVLDAFITNGFDIEKRDSIPKNYRLIGKKQYTSWPSEEVINNVSFWSKEYFINNDNWDIVNSQGNDVTYYYTNDLNKNIKKYIKKLPNQSFEIKSNQKNKLVVLDNTSSSVITEEIITPSSHILHFVGIDKNSKLNYRRFQLNSYLQANNKPDTIYKFLTKTNIECLTKKYKTIICSDPRGSQFLVDKAIEDGSVLIYDRTDNWSALGLNELKDENFLLDNASFIFCSSNYLYNTLSETQKQKAQVILNGCNVKPYIPQEKYTTPTAVYIGKNVEKIDVNYLNVLAEENPDWNFALYGVGRLSEDSLKSNIQLFPYMPEDQLHTVLSKSHVGLIPFVRSSWTAGMLPLKLFHYINAHLPTGFLNCDECNQFPEIAFDLAKCSLNEIIAKPIADLTYDSHLQKANWTDKFKAMLSVIKP